MWYTLSYCFAVVAGRMKYIPHDALGQEIVSLVPMEKRKFFFRVRYLVQTVEGVPLLLLSLYLALAFPYDLLARRDAAYMIGTAMGLPAILAFFVLISGSRGSWPRRCGRRVQKR